MLEITIPNVELWDEKSQKFVNIKEQTIRLEHSLVSLSKWEERWKKPFINTKEKTTEEILDYVRCMTLTQNVSPFVYHGLSESNFEDIHEYIEDPRTATKFYDDTPGSNRSTITNEKIYCWMIECGIPFDPCQKWHIERLLTLIRVCRLRNQPQKRHSSKEIMERNRLINERRKRELNTNG